MESNDTELTRALLGLPSKSTVPTEHSIYLHLHRQSSTQDSTQDSTKDSTASSRVKKEAEGKSKTGEADPVYVSEVRNQEKETCQSHQNMIQPYTIQPYTIQPS